MGWVKSHTTYCTETRVRRYESVRSARADPRQVLRQWRRNRQGADGRLLPYGKGIPRDQLKDAAVPNYHRQILALTVSPDSAWHATSLRLDHVS